MQVNLASTLEPCCCGRRSCHCRRPLHHIAARIVLAPRLTLELRSAGGIHAAEIAISFKDPATGAAIAASEWAARFGARVLPPPPPSPWSASFDLFPGQRSVYLLSERHAYRNSITARHEDFFAGLDIYVITQGRPHTASSELRRWGEGGGWAAPLRFRPDPWIYQRAQNFRWH
jgi:hypothetical protein